MTEGEPCSRASLGLVRLEVSWMLSMIEDTGTDKDHAASGVVGLNIQHKVIMLDKRMFFFGPATGWLKCG